MAEESGQERTEQATPRRKQQARERGQVSSSRDLNTMLILLISAGAIMFIGPTVVDGFTELFRQHLSVSRANIFDPMAMPRLFKLAIVDMLGILAPFFVVVTIAAIAGPLSMGGINFSAKAMVFKWDKLDPVKGLKRVFALKGLMELLKALAKFLIIGTVAVMFLYAQADAYIGLGSEPLYQALNHAVHLLMWAFLTVASALILIAVVDVPFQLWEFQRQLKMTHQEVRDDNKDTEGDPDVRARVRRVQREMAQRRMMAEVPKADVVVTNPEHYSVALRYDQETMSVPIVVAKGTDLIALQIRSIAKEHNIPMLVAPPLARSLHHTTDIDQEIPAGLYLAVAQVLAYIFQLRSAKSGQRPKDFNSKDLPIPDDLRFDG